MNPSRESDRPRRALFVVLCAGIVADSLCPYARGVFAQSAATDPAAQNAQRMLTEGRETFRFATFGDEAFWGDTVKLHQAIEGSRLGGVGAGVSPKTALSVGLKV